jgi:superfamily I DNA/RNA helicase
MYDMKMKRAQLLELEIPGSLLLVNECQDMDGCQVNWVAKQVPRGKEGFFIGDAAQSSYSFRGAKSRCRLELPVQVVAYFTLTHSWRFGPAIANIANIVLLAKEKSKQTTGKTKT